MLNHRIRDDSQYSMCYERILRIYGKSFMLVQKNLEIHA